MILGRYSLKPLGINVKLLKNTIEGGYGLFDRCTALMVNLGTYNFKILNNMMLPQKNIPRIHM